MTNMMLVRALQTRLQALLPEVSVYRFTLPKKTENSIRAGETRYPFLIVTPVKGGDSYDDAVVHVSLLFGVQSDDFSEEGAEMLFHFMEQVRQSLLKTRTLDSRYRLEDYDWELFEPGTQPKPEWFGEARTQWTLPTILEEVKGI